MALQFLVYVIYINLVILIAHEKLLFLSVAHGAKEGHQHFVHGFIIVHLFPFFGQEKDAILSEVESANKKMKVELEEFRTEASHLKNQQATIRKLEERTRQLEQQVISICCMTFAGINCYILLSCMNVK